MGPIERELRECDRGTGSFVSPVSNEAWLVYEAAHHALVFQQTGKPIGEYSGCCRDALSEAIEAAEALGL